jgi:hypothetical protein
MFAGPFMALIIIKLDQNRVGSAAPVNYFGRFCRVQTSRKNAIECEKNGFGT